MTVEPPSREQVNALPYGTVVDTTLPKETPAGSSPLMNSHEDMLDALSQPADEEQGETLMTGMLGMAALALQGYGPGDLWI